MQLKAQRPEPLNEAGAELSGLLLGVAVDDHIIRVTLERTAGVFRLFAFQVGVRSVRVRG